MRQLIRKSLFLGELSEEHRVEMKSHFDPLYAEYVTQNAGWWERWLLPSPSSGQELANFFLEKPSFECLVSARPPELLRLQEMAKHYFRQAGLLYDFDQTDVDIRYMQITLNGEDRPQPSSEPVSAHDELDSVLSFTCMMVCRKDEGVQGAHLNVMPDYGKSFLSDIAGLYTTHQVPLVEGSVVVRRSDMPYEMSPSWGTGVVQWVNVTISVDL